MITVLICISDSTGYALIKMDNAKNTRVWPKKSAGFMSVHYEKRSRYNDFTITAYCPGPCCCKKYADGFTATGKRAREENRIVAVDPNIIPLHSMVYIEGLGIFYAEDVGGMIKKRRLDILMNNHERALKFGVKKRRVTIIN
ncbi:MAG: Cell wall-binding protein YocH precursor [Candidatus Scalindua rubra]|uniref:Cell wall-binding protein YocH n=1 Tax=Candidatus Scalindua rubra TaxID=1872076 RepID=A0A1E3XEP9_9BACT|nr:MAG: Cell wall-binding protein YocH precursor [Candidatus Scalindua rubra]